MSKSKKRYIRVEIRTTNQGANCSYECPLTLTSECYGLGRKEKIYDTKRGGYFRLPECIAAEIPKGKERGK